jgi:hypothetical protein
MLETSALASMRALEVWRLLLCQWFRTAEPHAIQKAQAMQSVVAKRLAIRRADLALIRAMCRKRREELAEVRMRCRAITDEQRVVRFSERDPSDEAGRVSYYGS